MQRKRWTFEKENQQTRQSSLAATRPFDHNNIKLLRHLKLAVEGPCEAASLTLRVGESLGGHFPLDQHSEEGQHRPHPQDDPRKPAHWLLWRHLKKKHLEY